MANNLPYIFEENWELGTSLGSFDTEADTGSKLNAIHYAALAKYQASAAVLTDSIGPIVPWRGAFCIEIFAGDTNDHTLNRTTAVPIVTGKTGFSQFMLFIGNDFKATADDIFSIYEIQSSAGVQEATIALSITAATQAIQIASAQKPADLVFTNMPTLPRGRWICIELVDAVVTGSATGTTQVFVDGTAISAAITNAAVNVTVDRVSLGTQDTLSTTTGHLFFDCFKFSTNTASASTTRIGVPHDRYPENVLVTKSTHLALGTSEILNVTLLAGSGTDSVLKIYDTDAADLQDDTDLAAILTSNVAVGTSDLANVPVTVKRGAFVQLTGTVGAWSATSQGLSALVQIGSSQAWGSHGRVRQHGFKRAVNLNPEVNSQ